MNSLIYARFVRASMRVAVLSSGGKDSAAAWWWALCQGWTIDSLVTVRVLGDDSPMFQLPSTHLVERQANLAGLRGRSLDGIVSGALRSDYQKTRLERMCERLGIHSWTPLWHQSGQQHVREMIEHGFEIMITGVSAEGLNQEWLGHVLTRESFERLEALATKFRFHVEGEGGEYETLVLAGPHINGRLEVSTTKQWDGVRGHVEIH
jgi:diphthine-ammonia ligase